MDISIAFDPASMAKLEQLLSVDFGQAYTESMSQSLDLLQNYAIGIMQNEMINPQGTLEGNFAQTITPEPDSVTGELANATIYAWRQEEGYSGRTDSLGRFFSYTPEYHYMQRSLDDNTASIFDLFVEATKFKLATLGVL